MESFEAANQQAQRRHRELRATAEPGELARFLHDEHNGFHRMIARIGGNRRL